MRIDPTLYDAVRLLVKQKRKRRAATTIKAEMETAIRRHLETEQSALEAETLAPAIRSALDERFERLENRLAGITAKSGLDNATSLYILLYALAEVSTLLRAVDPENELAELDPEEWYKVSRKRAIAHFREKDPEALQSLFDDLAAELRELRKAK
jgi:hypothetical protein